MTQSSANPEHTMHAWKWAAALLAFALLSSSSRADEASDIEAATRLPMRADSLRKSGVSNEDVSTILQAAQQQGMHPDEAADVLAATEEAVRSGGSVDNLGSFVRSQVEAGLRGQALAATIKAEKANRGQGKPEHAGGEKPESNGGKPAHAGSGKPEHAGGSKAAGKAGKGGR